MPVTPTFPGIYIEEIQSSAHTITAAPTSVAVFVGYTHPYKTKRYLFNSATRRFDIPQDNFNRPVRLFSFADYERHFGGFFDSAAFRPDPTVDVTKFYGSVAHAVNQFFLNGGSECWVIGLQPDSLAPATPGDSVGSSQDVGGIKFTATEPTDTVTMNVAVKNLGKTLVDNDTADIVVSYGSRRETFRQVNLVPNSTSPLVQANFISSLNRRSSLVRVGGTFPATFTAANDQSVGTAPAAAAGFKAADFNDVFQADSDLDKLAIFNLLVIPGVTNSTVIGNALAFCERKRAFFIMDPDPTAVADGSGTTMEASAASVTRDKNGALYFPYLKSNHPVTGDAIDPDTQEPYEIPPSGSVAGVFANTDLTRGVWKAPAGLEANIKGVTGVVERGKMTDQRQGVLNPLGVNVIRDFPNVGTVIFGARTLVTTTEEAWRYVPVRRTALFLEQTLFANLGWVVFEPNDEPLWAAIRTSIEAFMLGLFRQGAFQGNTPSKAFQVKCDSQTTTQADVDNGIVNIVVAFAPLKPAEFVVIKIAQLAGQAQTA